MGVNKKRNKKLFILLPNRKMGKFNEMLSRYKAIRNAKKYWRSVEWQYYRDKLVKMIKDWKKEWKSKEELAEILWKEQWTVEYAEMMINCWRILGVELAKKLIDSWNKKFVLENIENFKNHNEIAKILIDSWNWVWVRNRLNQFNISDEKIKKELEELNKKKEEEEAAKKKELEEKLEKLKEIWDKFLKFGIKYTIDEKSLLLNIKWNIDEKIFPECYELGLFQYVEKIDGNLIVWKALWNPKYWEYIYSNHNFIFENLRCVKWDLVIDGSFPHSHCNVEAEKLWVVDWNLKLDGSSLKAPLERISWNCDVLNWSLQASNLRYIWWDLYLYKYTAPMGSEDWWIYFPVLRYVGGVELNGYNMGSNKSIEIGDNKVYWDVIYFIDPYDPRLKEKVDVICNYLSREYNRGLYDSIPTNEDYKTYIKTIPVDRDSYRDDD